VGVKAAANILRPDLTSDRAAARFPSPAPSCREIRHTPENQTAKPT